MIGLIGMAQVLATLTYGVKGRILTWAWPFFHDDPQQENNSQMDDGHSISPPRGQSPPSVKTRERRGSSFSQLGLEPNHTGLTAQSLFFLEESCRVKRSDTQTFSNFSNYFKRVLKLQKRSSSFSK